MLAGYFSVALFLPEPLIGSAHASHRPEPCCSRGCRDVGAGALPPLASSPRRHPAPPRTRSHSPLGLTGSLDQRCSPAAVGNRVGPPPSLEPPCPAGMSGSPDACRERCSTPCLCLLHPRAGLAPFPSPTQPGCERSRCVFPRSLPICVRTDTLSSVPRARRGPGRSSWHRGAGTPPWGLGHSQGGLGSAPHCAGWEGLLLCRKRRGAPAPASFGRDSVFNSVSVLRVPAERSRPWRVQSGAGVRLSYVFHRLRCLKTSLLACDFPPPHTLFFYFSCLLSCSAPRRCRSTCSRAGPGARLQPSQRTCPRVFKSWVLQQPLFKSDFDLAPWLHQVVFLGRGLTGLAVKLFAPWFRETRACSRWHRPGPRGLAVQPCWGSLVASKGTKCSAATPPG